ncbi:MAG: dTMP kinase [Candidatus Palauibacterales bacterium]|nr:dTMP kinase [Candidatus Palauibacterales bacterium]MDP2482958.1 dTMP kinase [Candidatus Palauibacterales bacterium]
MSEGIGSGGLFIAFEGGEGAGKSTHLRRLTERLERAGIAHLLVREPGGTPAGERIRRIVLDRDLSICPETELLLYLASRAEFVKRVVKPALERGELVLADRYEMSTYAYQGIARGLGLERVRKLNEFATGGLKPDGTVLLALDPDVGRERQRGQADRLESEHADFHRAVARAYTVLAESEPGVVTIASDGPTVEVQERLWLALSERWPDRFPPAG